MAVIASRDEVAEIIGDAVIPLGWRVTTDPRNVNPPVVVVGPPERLGRAPCGLIGQCQVSVVHAGPGNDDAARAIVPIVELIGPLLDWPDRETADPTVYYPDPSGDNGFPAYAFPVTVAT